MIAYAAPRTGSMTTAGDGPIQVGHVAASYGSWTLSASLWSEAMPPCGKPLPFGRAWFVQPSSPREWRRVESELGCTVLKGWVRVGGGACEYGRWLVDVDLERAVKAGALIHQRDLIEWDRRSVNVFTPASAQPLLELAWRLG